MGEVIRRGSAELTFFAKFQCVPEKPQMNMFDSEKKDKETACI